ncbi:probable E3 ubiquitin-protein ligase MID2 [Ruditapes philippinarum]|uniref:probable E3 ubiquitin-protein ligase MID2 n=1 Tax=Ruditapes philippinarum TaxID=129788 RepID=UPI00295ACC7B|nr:probable E3 ubiquitin-protein ligase MID2 [Ruditapes philippinarum]
MATGGQINTDTLSDEVFDVLCTICKSKSKNTDGVKYCVDCQDYFCIKCVKVHSQVPVCAGHRVLDKSLVTSGIIKGLLRAPEERCDRHSHKHIDMYCQNHDSVGCSTCMAVDHRACQDTFYIPEFIRNNTYQSASTEIQTKLKEISKTLAEQVTNFKQDKQRLLKRKAELLADIRKFRQEINDQLDKLEKNSIDEIEDMFKRLVDKIENNLKQLQANMARVTSANDKLASPNTNQAEVFVQMKIGEDAANVANKHIADNKRKSIGDDIEFQSEKTILSLLQQNKALGRLKNPSKPKTPDTLFQIKERHSSYESQSYLKSACCLKDGAIVIADYSNKRLERDQYNNYTVTDYCDLPGKPWQVCSINTTQVAVTLPSQKEVHFISVEGQMSTTKKIDTDFVCFGLAYKNNNLYISDSGTDIYIYTLSGRKLNQLTIFLRKTRSFISKFANPFNMFHQQYMYIPNLAVSKDATRIYVADRVRGLIVLDNNGKVITNYDGENLYGANCCYVTEAGSVLVSGYNNVLQFTSDGELIGDVIKNDRRKGTIVSVCCNQQMSKMYVSRDRKNSIEVYDI